MSEATDESMTYRWFTPKVVFCVATILLVVVALWIGLGALTFRVSTGPWFDGKGFTARAAQIGDTFGATNALFSALAIALIAVSTILQTQELRAQRIIVKASQEQLKAQLEELTLAREETRLTREEHAKTANALARQVELSTLSAAVSSTAALASAYIESSEGIQVQQQFSRYHRESDAAARQKWVDGNRVERQFPQRAVVHIVELQELQSRLLQKLSASTTATE